MNVLNKSKETTLAGMMAAIALIFQQVANLLDDDPTTTMEISIVIAAIGIVIGFWRARDNNKSSETVGAK